MSPLFWLADAQMVPLQPFSPKGHGRPPVDGRHDLGGVILVNHNWLRGCEAAREAGLSKTLCNRWNRWNRMGGFFRIMTGLAVEAADEKAIMINATYLKTCRAASSLR